MEPNYVLKANEGVIMPVNNSKTYYYVKKILWIIIAIIIIGSIILGENIFTQLNMSVRVLLIVAVIYFLFIANKKHKVASPFEIRFYDNYLIVYREKFYYDPKTTRMEYDKFFYKDIRICEFRTGTEKINIYGIVEGIFFKYKKDGSLPEKPTYHKTTDSICSFYTTHSDVDFVHEIEAQIGRASCRERV